MRITFIQTFRSKEAQIPLLILSRIALARDKKSDALKKRLSLRDFQQDLVNEFKLAGDENIYFIDGGTLLDPPSIK